MTIVSEPMVYPDTLVHFNSTQTSYGLLPEAGPELEHTIVKYWMKVEIEQTSLNVGSVRRPLFVSRVPLFVTRVPLFVSRVPLFVPGIAVICVAFYCVCIVSQFASSVVLSPS